MFNFVKTVSDLVGLGKKVASCSKKFPRTHFVLNKVIGKVLTMGVMVGMLAGAIKYGIDLFCGGDYEKGRGTVSGLATI